jgi:hypothetical protein
MEELVASDTGTKEVSECWNSISIIANSELARGIYLTSSNGIKYLFTYQAAQDAFFTSEGVKQQIVSDNIMLIVNDNDLLELLYNDTTVYTVIASNTIALVTIASSSTKINIVKDNATILNALLTNNAPLNAMSQTDFNSFMETQTTLNIILGNSNAKNKIDSYSLDELVPVLNYWANTSASNWNDIVSDSDTLATVLANTNCSNIL